MFQRAIFLPQCNQLQSPVNITAANHTYYSLLAEKPTLIHHNLLLS